MPSTRRKRWLFRSAAAALSLMPLVVFELVCIAAGWGVPSGDVDPFVGFSTINPLFVKDRTGERYVIAPNRLQFFAPDEFPVRKGERTFRAFCLGGSTVQGNPYSIETSFVRWLQLALNEADPSRDWEFVNCGGVSYASYRLVPILQEVLEYQPDLIILCTGHNEFLEDRSYPAAKRIPTWTQRPLAWLAQRRTTVLLARMIPDSAGSRASGKPRLSGETEPMLDYHNGIAAYHWDPAWHQAIVEHYAYNVRRMIHLCQDEGIPIVVIKPASNLADSPPFKSEHRRDLTAEELERFELEIDAARAAYSSQPAEAVYHLKRALEIDPQYALTWYELGQVYEVLGDVAAAREAFVAARDRDVCPLRMTSALEQALNQVVQEESVPYLDAHAVLEARVQRGILGDYWLVDHIHPSFEGHQLIALELVELLSEFDVARPQQEWEPQARAAFKRHFDALDRAYFHQGQRRLEGLINWAHGRADGPPVETRFPHRLRRDVRSVPPSAREYYTPASTIPAEN